MWLKRKSSAASARDHGPQQHPVGRAQVLRLVHDDVPVPGLAGGRELTFQPCRVRGDAAERPQVRLVQPLGELLGERPDLGALRPVELTAPAGAAIDNSVGEAMVSSWARLFPDVWEKKMRNRQQYDNWTEMEKGVIEKTMQEFQDYLASFDTSR